MNHGLRWRLMQGCCWQLVPGSLGEMAAPGSMLPKQGKVQEPPAWGCPCHLAPWGASGTAAPGGPSLWFSPGRAHLGQVLPELLDLTVLHAQHAAQQLHHIVLKLVIVQPGGNRRKEQKPRYFGEQKVRKRLPTAA